MKTPTSIRLGKKLYSLNDGLVMGILNITPDSFYSASRVSVDSELIPKLNSMLEAGVDILDVGALSSRPGAELLTQAEEWSRLKPVLKLLRNEFPDLPVSVDTFRSEIAMNSVEMYGVKMINDISAGDLDNKMSQVIGKLKVPIVLMHMKGKPNTMQNEPEYADVTQEILAYFGGKIEEFLDKGAEDIILDPGFGFGKTIEHNYQILSNLRLLRDLGFPVLAGLSRKSMIYKSLDLTPELSLNGTTVVNTLARQNGADILRVHDVKEARECLKLCNLLVSRDKFTLSAQ